MDMFGGGACSYSTDPVPSDVWTHVAAVYSRLGHLHQKAKASGLQSKMVECVGRPSTRVEAGFPREGSGTRPGAGVGGVARRGIGGSRADADVCCASGGVLESVLEPNGATSERRTSSTWLTPPPPASRRLRTSSGISFRPARLQLPKGTGYPH